MGALYDRRCRMTIALPVKATDNFSDTQSQDVIEIGNNEESNRAGLRVIFHISLSDKKDPNTSKITVHNLSPSRRASLQQKGVKVSFEAGYAEDGTSLLFFGDVRFVDHVREGATWKTVFKLGDAQRAYEYARLSESFAAGTPYADVFIRLAKASGLAMGNVVTRARQIVDTFDQGYVVYGPVIRSMARLADSVGLSLSVQGGTLQLLGPDETLRDPIIYLSPETGLIGSPEMGTAEKKGKPQLVKFTSYLMPCKPGRTVQLKSERYDSLVAVKKVEFIGDTHGGSGTWKTQYEAQAMKTAG